MAIGQTILLSGVIVISTGPCWAFQGYNVVITTSSSIEQNFLQSTTDQWNANVVPDTLAPPSLPTYQIQLLNPNANYVLPGQVVPSAPCQLDQDEATFVTQSTVTYLYGWRDGATYFQNAIIGNTGTMANLCANATNFTLIQATTTTWNKATCEDALGSVINNIYTIQTGTPTIIPGEP